MAFATTTSRPAAPGFFARLWADFAAWRDARATYTALSKLSDRELDDIGLTRADIDQLIDRDIRL